LVGCPLEEEDLSENLSFAAHNTTTTSDLLERALNKQRLKSLLAQFGLLVQDLSLGEPTGLFSKDLRDNSKRIKVSTIRGMGLREDSVWNEITNSRTDRASNNAQDISRQLEMANVYYLQGFAAVSAEDDPSVGTTTDLLTVSHSDGLTQTIHAHKILTVTGSKPLRPAGIPFDGKRIFDSDSFDYYFVLRFGKVWLELWQESCTPQGRWRPEERKRVTNHTRSRC
jgi:hypothetical protein